MECFVRLCRAHGASLILAFFLLPMLPGAAVAGTLRVLSSNPRYFTDDGNRAIYLSGSHTWTNMRDRSDLPTFDFPGYLDFLASHHHNFIRLWASNYNVEYLPPYAYPRTGPGNALDGQPKFDLSSFDQRYFDRLRARVIAARDRGFYVSIMLFQDHARLPEDWANEAFNVANNKNGINGDPNGDGSGVETYSMSIPAIVALHEAYVRKVVDTLNDLDNVLYEICNESAAQSTSWQYHLIDYIKSYEATKPKQHPVGMTFQYPNGSNQTLFSSNAEWISPNDSAGYTSNPPVGDGAKVVLVDTDHLCGTCSDPTWPWKNFLRGHNFLLMDPYYSASSFESTRKAMGYAVDYSKRMDLARATPQPGLSSTGYVLANPGQEYLVYQPSSGSFTVNLQAGSYGYEWFDPSSGTVKGTGSFSATAGNRSFTPPNSGMAVLYLVAGGTGGSPSNVPLPPGNLRFVNSSPQQVTFKLYGANNLDALTLPSADVTIAVNPGRMDWVRSGTSTGPLVSTTPSLGTDNDGVTASAATIHGPGVFHVDVDGGAFASASATIAGVTKPFALDNGTYVATFTVSNPQSGALTLAWDAPTANSDGSTPATVTGYKVYWGTSQSSFPSSAGVSGTSYTVGSLASGTWYFVVTAISVAGESGYSAAVSTTIEGTPLPEEPPPPSGDPCVVTPLERPTNLVWPASRNGASTLGWTSPANIVSVDYSWPSGGRQSATWTDDRGCGVTVTR